MYTSKSMFDLAIDPGNGTTCVASSRLNPFLFPSVTQRVEDIRLDGRGSQGDVIHFERLNEQTKQYQDRKSFAFGDTALLLPGLQVRMTTKDRIGSEYQLVLILAATVRALEALISSDASERKVTVNWLLNCPPIYYSLASKLYDLAGEYKVEYNRRTYFITGTVGWVYPEGAGAAAAYMLDEKGRFAIPDFASGRTGVVDSGYRTIDACILAGPTLLENTAISLTNSISGVYQLMQKWARDEFSEEWNENEVEAAIRNGYCVLRETKERMDLTDWIDDLGSRLADLIDTEVFGKQWNGLGDVDRVVLAGGVSYMIEHHLKERYPNVILLRSDYAHTKDIGYEFMNAVGHVRLLLAERAAAK